MNKIYRNIGENIMNTKFNVIDLATWERGQMFYYFSKMAPTGYSLTVDLDITIMKKELKANDIKFFPGYLYLVTKTLNKQVEFKIAEKEEVLGYWDSLTPMYANFHEDNKTFSLMWTPYNENFNLFYKNYLDNQNQFGNNHGVLSQPDNLPPANCYTVSSVPWISFKHFSVHNYDNKQYYFPSVEVGKFHEENGKLLMPLSITLHHATTDGYHVNKFLEELQNEMNHPENWI